VLVEYKTVETQTVNYTNFIVAILLAATCFGYVN